MRTWVEDLCNCRKSVRNASCAKERIRANGEEAVWQILTIVQCFSLSRPDVKFICSNIVAGQFVTPGKATTREVVFNLFGGRTDKTKMVEILRCHPNDEHGFGRSTADRQFVYVNRRPVDYPKICRVINEVYQQYNRSQYPTLVLYIELPPEMIDVNVTPDKRTVLFDHEKELLALIRSSVLATFSPSPGVLYFSGR
ncbi:hypothetical protein KIN20_019299 [Parelaphostrongylus tenuis]|uniref:DNA mismatch repair protein S5 domain-containing protein n=1 Tax=Parelaphostrongylus tenuis TaxID=148309 RepID=A0AAD5QSU8_PARTN|nr:hypothetical protein KIN20_019299 [Parelaphostrongylus tenuis]